MIKNEKPVRDAFTFSLGGISTISSFTAARAVACDRLNKVRDEQKDAIPDDQPNTAREIWGFIGRYWPRAMRRAA